MLKLEKEIRRFVAECTGAENELIWTGTPFISIRQPIFHTEDYSGGDKFKLLALVLIIGAILIIKDDFLIFLGLGTIILFLTLYLIQKFRPFPSIIYGLTSSELIIKNEGEYKKIAYTKMRKAKLVRSDNGTVEIRLTRRSDGRVLVTLYPFEQMEKVVDIINDHIPK